MPDVLSPPRPATHDQPALTGQIEASSHARPAPAEAQPALPLRNDTMLGVCEAIGQDFGFNPNYLRIFLASLVVWNMTVAFGLYLGLGVIVAVSRWLAPARPAAAAQQPAADRDGGSVPANANTALSAAA